MHRLTTIGRMLATSAAKLESAHSVGRKSTAICQSQIRLASTSTSNSSVKRINSSGSSFNPGSSSGAAEPETFTAPAKATPAFKSTDTPDQNLSGSLFNPSEGYLQGSQWSTSFEGMATEPFETRIGEILMAPVAENEIEIKPDGLLYLPEIKYRRILNRAFGPGGWGLVPRGAHSVAGRTLSREYALICLGRFISQARGEQDYFDEGGLATATEGCKSNALVRCCKDLGVASELWDPAFISKFKAKHCAEEWVTHAVKGNKKRMWRLKERQWEYPWSKK